jgi:hypothetical protein
LGHESNLYLIVLALVVTYLIIEWRTLPSPPTKKNYLIRSALFSLGFAADWILSKLELISFSSDNTNMPFWLILMWLLFSVTFYSCYGWLKNKVWLAGILGSAFGPLAYWAASEMSGVQILSPIAFTLSSAFFWSITFMCFSYLNKYR